EPEASGSVAFPENTKWSSKAGHDDGFHTPPSDVRTCIRHGTVAPFSSTTSTSKPDFEASRGQPAAEPASTSTPHWARLHRLRFEAHTRRDSTGLPLERQGSERFG